jgi:hypothetical protein
MQCCAPVLVHNSNRHAHTSLRVPKDQREVPKRRLDKGGRHHIVSGDSYLRAIHTIPLPYIRPQLGTPTPNPDLYESVPEDQRKALPAVQVTKGRRTSGCQLPPGSLPGSRTRLRLWETSATIATQIKRLQVFCSSQQTQQENTAPQIQRDLFMPIRP